METPHKKINPELMVKLNEAFAPHPEAFEFIVYYKEYIHLIDDLNDNPQRPSSEDILKVTAKASVLFSLPFWIKNHGVLLITEQLINNTYADSVLWEKDPIPHKTVAADTLRHAGLDMFFATILITLGREKLREFSPLFRQQCHELQQVE